MLSFVEKKSLKTGAQQNGGFLFPVVSVRSMERNTRIHCPQKDASIR
jgi:hypothetical protein